MRIITREDINRLKLQRKKKLKKLWITTFVTLLLVAGISVGTIMWLDDSKKGESINVNVNPDMGDGFDKDVASKTDVNHDITTTENIDTEASSTEITTEDTTVNTNSDATSSGYYERYVENAKPEDFVYDVPDNALPDINTVVGNDWADENTFVQNSKEPIPLNFFDDAVFVGDSRTEGLLLYSNLGNLNGICYKGLNVGALDSEKCILLSGEKEKITCFEAISRTSYDYYYCMFGVNELGWIESDSFIEYFEDLIDHIYSVNPNAIVYVENVMPVTRKLSEENDVFKLERIKEYNDLLLKMCQKRKDVVYLDVFSAVADEEGYLPDDASPDGVHCGMSYCMRVIQYIRMNTYSRK